MRDKKSLAGKKECIFHSLSPSQSGRKENASKNYNDKNSVCPFQKRDTI
jgi:hypothetical protein